VTNKLRKLIPECDRRTDASTMAKTCEVLHAAARKNVRQTLVSDD